MDIFFATTNKNKFKEASKIFEAKRIEIKHLETSYPELQSENLEQIAKYGAIYIANKYKKKIFVEDSGLFIKLLNGFPGPYSAYAYKTIGRKGILRLLHGIENREAVFKSVVAYCEPDKQPHLFVGEVYGKISFEERGTSGFAFDAIFIPEEGDGRTFAEMKTIEKNRISHRSRALKNLLEWLVDL